MFYVYVIESAVTRRKCVGMTESFTRRFKQHNSDQSKSTKGRGPWRVVHIETVATRLEARAREKYFKSGVGREEIKRAQTLKFFSG